MDPNLPIPPGEPEPAGPPPSAVNLTLAGRNFAFYPPIRNVHHNEWRFVRETWAEMLVTNQESRAEVWIPRRLLAAISSVDQPFPIVGLHKELELRAGSVWPYRPKLLEMPRGSGTQEPFLPSAPSLSGRRLASTGSPAEKRVARLIGISLLLAIFGMFGILAIFRGEGVFGNRVISQTADQDYLVLRAGDDYYAIVQRLGKPHDDRWRAQSKEVAFRVLEYSDRSYSVVLFGADQASATYLGALDSNWRPIHSVPVGRGVDSTSILRTLPRF